MLLGANHNIFFSTFLGRLASKHQHASCDSYEDYWILVFKKEKCLAIISRQICLNRFCRRTEIVKKKKKKKLIHKFQAIVMKRNSIHANRS